MDLQTPLSQFYVFKNQALLEEALTHSSYSARHSLGYNNERLEFLGDSILSAAVTTMLYSAFIEQEGQMTKRRSSLTSDIALTEVAKGLSLGKYIKCSQPAIATNSMLACALESIVGAIYLDGGFEAAQEFVTSVFSQYINRPLYKDYKTDLQEYTQRLFKITPSYEIIAAKGPDHNPTFVACVHLVNFPAYTGVGKNRKEAEKEAAKAALLALTK